MNEPKQTPGWGRALIWTGLGFSLFAILYTLSGVLLPFVVAFIVA